MPNLFIVIEDVNARMDPESNRFWNPSRYPIKNQSLNWM